ncbi:putative zinc-binding metallopeptidase [Sorangium sp. So ce1078]|uniref:putative zinc-binding metallopeptidase n=1 Tax=Sorangium sp. So ce1078 TaxID=3133329 RepID=UPI003F5FCE65
MAAAAPPAGPAFHESSPLGPVPFRDLGLTIAGTRLEAIIAEFTAELELAGLRRVRPRFYLSTEWGVPFNTVSIGIPFYLARPDLTALHRARAGHVEGVSRADCLRYLRHEMGHVVNYAYRLYDEQEWTERFGSLDAPYHESYRPVPFSRRYVVHLPGWYAQKHPDEDWAETFAVWMTPGRAWRVEYADWPEALAKLEYCDRAMAALRDRDPVVTDDELDEDVAELGTSLDEYYGAALPGAGELPRGFDGALRAIFDELDELDELDEPGAERPAAGLILDMERELVASVYRSTGHFPEATRPLVRHLAGRAGELGLTYRAAGERTAVIAFAALVTALAMNHVRTGSYFS